MRTGEITDTDLELNGNVAFTCSGGSPDVGAVVTNQIGGMLGLGRFTFSQTRTLSAEQIEAICTVYPADGPTLMQTTGTPFAISPTTITVAPRAQATFSVSNACGGVTWMLKTNQSGATLSAGRYIAGAIDDAQDVIEASDGITTVEAIVNIGPRVRVNPADSVVAANARLTFHAEGGAGAPYTWSLQTNASGGAVSPSTGDYIAGPNTGVDFIQATDALGNTGIASVTVGGPGCGCRSANVPCFPIVALIWAGLLRFNRLRQQHAQATHNRVGSRHARNFQSRPGRESSFKDS